MQRPAGASRAWLGEETSALHYGMESDNFTLTLAVHAAALPAFSAAHR